MATQTIPEDKTQRMVRILAEAEDRVRHELMDEDERLILEDRIRRLRRKLEIRA